MAAKTVFTNPSSGVLGRAIASGCSSKPVTFALRAKKGTTMQSKRVTQIEDPPIARALFGDTRFAWIGLIVRLYVGWQWLSEGIIKAQTPAWAGSQAGVFLTTWIDGALKKSAGPHPDVQGWYGAFLSNVVLPHAAFWSVLVTYGEIFVGLGLILGLFTGIAAFFGTTMNASYMLAGTVSTNPILFALGSFLVLAWKTAGWWGLDRWVLARLGTPWKNRTANTAATIAAQPVVPAA